MLRLAMVHNCLNGRAPQYMCTKFTKNQSLGYCRTRGSDNLYLMRPKTELYRNSFEFRGAFHWNQLPSSMKVACSVNVFKNVCKAFMLNNNI